MNWRGFKQLRDLGTPIKLAPPPEYKSLQRQFLHNNWYIEAGEREKNFVGFKNVQTNHRFELKSDSINDFREPDFVDLRCKILIDSDQISFEPITAWSSFAPPKLGPLKGLIYGSVLGLTLFATFKDHHAIHTANGAIQIYLEEPIGRIGYILGTNSHLSFIKDNKPILIMRSNITVADRDTAGQSYVRAIVDSNAPGSQILSTLSDLQEAQALETGLATIPNNTKIKGGEITATINGATQLHFYVPAQTVTDGLIHVKGLKGLPGMLSKPEGGKSA